MDNIPAITFGPKPRLESMVCSSPCQIQNGTWSRYVLIFLMCPTFLYCKPASDPEYPYGVSPPSRTIVASGPLPSAPKHKQDISKPQSSEMQHSAIKTDDSNKNSTQNASQWDGLTKGGDDSKKIDQPHVQVEIQPSSIVGRNWVGTHHGVSYTWELRDNGFFEFRGSHPDGGLIQRMGTYQFQNAALLIQFREIKTTPAQEKTASETHNATGSETIPMTSWSDGRLRLGEVWLSPQ